MRNQHSIGKKFVKYKVLVLSSSKKTDSSATPAKIARRPKSNKSSGTVTSTGDSLGAIDDTLLTKNLNYDWASILDLLRNEEQKKSRKSRDDRRFG